MTKNHATDIAMTLARSAARVTIVISLVVALFLAASGQTKTLVLPSPTPVPTPPPPGNLQIDGFVWTPRIAKDAITGQISDSKGFVIDLSKSSVRNFYSGQFTKKDDLLWFKQQQIHGQLLDIGLFKDGRVVASFDSTTNFTAKPSSTEQWAMFLLIVLTYQGDRVKGLSAGPVTPDSEVRIPGNIQLLDGYTYEQKRGIDSWVGVIKRNGGIEIDHDVGVTAGNGASRAQKDGWYMGQFVSSDELWCAYSKDGNLVATFVKSDANFYGLVKYPENIVDFFLMIMTYTPNPEYMKKNSEGKRLMKPQT